MQQQLSLHTALLIFFSSSGLPCWLSGKESTCQCRRHGFDPWIGKIPWRGKWQTTPVFLPEKSHGQKRSQPATVEGVIKSQIQLCNWADMHLSNLLLEKKPPPSLSSAQRKMKQCSNNVIKIHYQKRKSNPKMNRGPETFCRVLLQALCDRAVTRTHHFHQATLPSHTHSGSESEVTQSCPTLCNPMDCSLPDASVHGIFQARILEWVAISFSKSWVIGGVALRGRLGVTESLSLFWLPHVLGETFTYVLVAGNAPKHPASDSWKKTILSLTGKCHALTGKARWVSLITTAIPKKSTTGTVGKEAIWTDHNIEFFTRNHTL